MTDYLEALLPEEAGEELTLELGQRLPPRRRETEAAAWEPSPAGAGTAELPEAPAGERQGEPDRLWAPLEEKARRGAWLERALGGPGEAGPAETAAPRRAPGGTPEAGGREPAAAALLEGLSRARRAAGYAAGPGGGAATLSVPQERISAGGGLELEALDRAVQRDARRYDGGFALF